MDELRVRFASVAGRVVAMLVALPQPWVVVGGETAWSQSTCLHTCLQRQELAVQLGAAGDVETLVNRDDLHCNHVILGVAVGVVVVRLFANIFHQTWHLKQ